MSDDLVEMSPEVPGKGRKVASVWYNRKGGKQPKNSMCYKVT